jgi:hypothetical protein
MSLLSRLQEKYAQPRVSTDEKFGGHNAPEALCVAAVATVTVASPPGPNFNTNKGQLVRGKSGLEPEQPPELLSADPSGRLTVWPSRQAQGHILDPSPTQPSHALDILRKINSFSNATLTVATYATQPPSPSCDTCRFASKFKNCTEPVESGLSAKFMLISHPDAGKSCAEYSPIHSLRTEEVIKRLHQAHKLGAITDTDYLEANQSIEKSMCDESLIEEWHELIERCIQAGR